MRGSEAALLAENLLGLAAASKALGADTLQDWLRGDYELTDALNASEPGYPREDVCFGYGYLLGWADANGYDMAQALDTLEADEAEGLR